jgi:hypothetical protein
MQKVAFCLSSLVLNSVTEAVAVGSGERRSPKAPAKAFLLAGLLTRLALTGAGAALAVGGAGSARG